MCYQQCRERRTTSGKESVARSPRPLFLQLLSPPNLPQWHQTAVTSHQLASAGSHTHLHKGILKPFFNGAAPPLIGLNDFLPSFTMSLHWNLDQEMDIRGLSSLAANNKLCLTLSHFQLPVEYPAWIKTQGIDLCLFRTNHSARCGEMHKQLFLLFQVELELSLPVASFPNHLHLWGRFPLSILTASCTSPTVAPTTLD